MTRKPVYCDKSAVLYYYFEAVANPASCFRIPSAALLLASLSIPATMKQCLLLAFFCLGTFINYAQNCSSPLKIVVLGSSTAWGNGLPNRDSAWPFRYARYLKANHNAADTVINLAIGGYTTQQIMPNGTPPYTTLGTPLIVDTAHNITKAISLQPDAIIINMPTNDEAKGFPLDKQLANFRALKQAAAKARIPLWVSTTQPRGNLGYDAATRLRQMKDTIIKYFGAHAIDFYTGMATSKGFIVPLYNSGDDVHFNSLGQSILFSRVVAAAIPDSLCAYKSIPPASDTTPKPGWLFPNPATDHVQLQGIIETVFSVAVYNSTGALIHLQQNTMSNRLDVRNWRPGIYFIIVNQLQRYKLVKM